MMNNLIPEKYFMSRFYYPRLRLINAFGRPVLIWNMGKVASTSIARSLWRHIGRYNVLTTHFMNRDGYARSQLLYEVLIKNSNKSLPIITLTREPISKNISSFFQNFEINVGVAPQSYKGSAQELCDHFLHEFDKHEVTTNWFDDNIKRFIGLDVYQHPFDPEKGYSIIEHGRFSLLVLRSEESDSTKSDAVKTLLKLDTFSLENENIGANKPYSTLYSEFKKQLQLPQTYLDTMLDSKYTRHFYSPEEIGKIKDRWSPQNQSGNGSYINPAPTL